MIKATKKSEIKRGWHLIDAKGEILGRLATKVVPLLLGNNKPYFVRNLDCGDHVVIINAGDIKVTGKKEQQKTYQSFSGYPGGLREISYAQMKERFPEKIIEKAIRNMLPKNKLRDCWMGKLHVFAGSEHNYKDKFKEIKKESKKEEK
jgi:large subunit ribosomal protein L13